MNWLSRLGDRWPVIGPALAAIAINLGVAFGLDLEEQVQATIAALTTLIATLLAMQKAWRPTSVEAAKADARELGRAEGAMQVLNIGSAAPAGVNIADTYRDPVVPPPPHYEPPDAGHP